jgi:hypothetical protein
MFRLPVAAVAAFGLTAGTLLALPSTAQAGGYLACESGTSIFCNAPTDAAGNEVWTISPYASGADSSEATNYRGVNYANFPCDSYDQAHHTWYWITLSYTDTSNNPQTSTSQRQCLQITP